jgi:hypothetical protein
MKTRPHFPQKRGHEIGKWVLIGETVQKLLYCPCLFEKKMDDAQTQFLGPDQKHLCMGSIKIFWSSPDTSCSGNWGSLGKKMQTLPSFVPSPIKGFFFFFFFLGEILPKSDPKKNGSNLPK